MSLYLAMAWLYIMAAITKTKNFRSMLIFKVLPAAIATYVLFDNFIVGRK